MANWFVALPVRAGSWFSAVVGAPSGVRLFDAEDLHVTIAFLGACGQERARLAWDALAWPLPATVVSLGPVVPFGDARRPSALSAEIVKCQAELAAAIGACRNAVLDAAGARREARSPRPHVTLARPARKASADDRARAVAWARGLSLGAPEVTLDRAALYTWSPERKGDGGRQFAIVAFRPFAAPLG